MKQEEKELLLKDLCARWMTDLKCVQNTKNSIVAYCTVDGIKRDIKGSSFIELTDRDVDGNTLASTSTNELDIVKPYLRSMSSMTEEEWKEYKSTWKLVEHDLEDIYEPCIESYDWLNVHHFDYRGLIKRGLALEAPEDMYKS